MKQSWKRIGVILLIVIMGLNLYGCFTPKRTASQIEAALEAKYGEEFRVINMGGRNGGNMDVITAHCYPVANEDIVFQVQLDSNGNLVRDGYVSEYVTNEIEQLAVNLFEKWGMEAQLNLVSGGIPEIYNLDLTDENLLEIVTGYDTDWGGSVAVRDTGDLEEMAEIFYSVADEMLELNPDIQIRFGIHIICDKDYDACIERMRKVDHVSMAFFEDFETKGYVEILINRGEIEGINKTVEEILQELEKK